jgi:NADPH2:quinone reductase
VPVAGITASIALNKARVDKTASVFIAGGAGGAGTFTILLARQLGVRNLVTTAGNAKSRDYLIAACGLSDDQIIDYKNGSFIEQAMQHNGGGFDVALDLVGGNMLSACCVLLALDGNLASITEAPGQDDFAALFQKNASFQPVGANASSLTNDRAIWRKYRKYWITYRRILTAAHSHHRG